MEPILEMRHISKAFFGTKANDDISLKVFPGEIHALLGENGAGKTTLMNILYGIYTADSGEIIWKGKKVKFASPKDAIECGMGMVHQHFALVDTLTVSENITLGIKSKGYPFTDREFINNKINEISKTYGLDVIPDAKISTLSVGEQQRVEIMKLLYRDVDLLVLDEPTAVLTPSEIEDFFKVLKRLKEKGKASIIITHRIPEVMEISDTVTILRDGMHIATANIGEFNEESLSMAMIGRNLNILEKGKALNYAEEGLVIDNISVEEKKQLLLKNVSLHVHGGEILGIAGVDGNGQKQLAEAIVGIRKYKEGSISLNGICLDKLSINKRKCLGIGYVSDDRHRDGLVMDMSLCENMLLRSDRSDFVKMGFISHKALRKFTEDSINKFSIKTYSADVPIRLLSGGNQQKLILAREIDGNVKLVIAFQPTRGLDIGATEFIRELLLQYRNAGCAVLLISADLEEILSIADRIAVIHSGMIMGEVESSSSVNMTDIGLMMAGKKIEESQSGEDNEGRGKSNEKH